MVIAGEARHWQQGRVSLLDDSFLHEVRNDCAVERVVFQVAVRHPDAGGSPDDAPLVRDDD